MSRFLRSLLPPFDEEAKLTEVPDCLPHGARPVNEASLAWIENRAMSTPATSAEADSGPMPGTVSSAWYAASLAMRDSRAASTAAALAWSSDIRAASMDTASSSVAVRGLPDADEVRAAVQRPSAFVQGTPIFSETRVR